MRKDVGRAHSGFAESAEREGVVAFGKAFALIVVDELMVMEFRLGEIEEGLQETVRVGRRQEVFAPGDVRDVLGRIVADDGEMVGGANVLAGENDVAEEERIDGGFAMFEVVEGQWPGPSGGFLCIETPGGFFVGRDVFEITAGAGVKWSFGAVRGIGEMAQFGFDFPSGAEAGIDYVE